MNHRPGAYYVYAPGLPINNGFFWRVPHRLKLFLKIADETAQRVLPVASEMGYSPNPIARAMTSRHTGVIGLLVPSTLSASLNNPFLPVFMQATVRIRWVDLRGDPRSPAVSLT